MSRASPRTGFVDYAYSLRAEPCRETLSKRGFRPLPEPEPRPLGSGGETAEYLGTSTPIKYGFEYLPEQVRHFPGVDRAEQRFANPLGMSERSTERDLGNPITVNGFRVTNNFEVCTVRGTAIVCPSNPMLLPAAAVPSFAAQNTGGLRQRPRCPAERPPYSRCRYRS